MPKKTVGFINNDTRAAMMQSTTTTRTLLEPSAAGWRITTGVGYTALVPAGTNRTKLLVVSRHVLFSNEVFA